MTPRECPRARLDEFERRIDPGRGAVI